MKKLAFILVAAFLVNYFWGNNPADNRPHVAEPGHSNSLISAAFENQQSDVQVEGHGEVVRVLPDDRDGSRHQRFILRLNSGQTVLIAHNIDLAPRISALSNGDLVEFFGEYAWNPQGGVIHWTHHDPRGAHIDGWLKHKGRTYE